MLENDHFTQYTVRIYGEYNSNRKQRRFLLMVNKLYTVTFSIHHSIHNHNLSIVAIAIIQMSQDG